MQIRIETSTQYSINNSYCHKSIKSEKEKEKVEKCTMKQFTEKEWTLNESTAVVASE